jgi:hypothetical protein
MNDITFRPRMGNTNASAPPLGAAIHRTWSGDGPTVKPHLLTGRNVG